MRSVADACELHRIALMELFEDSTHAPKKMTPRSRSRQAGHRKTCYDRGPRGRGARARVMACVLQRETQQHEGSEEIMSDDDPMASFRPTKAERKLVRRFRRAIQRSEAFAYEGSRFREELLLAAA